MRDPRPFFVALAALVAVTIVRLGWQVAGSDDQDTALTNQSQSVAARATEQPTVASSAVENTVSDDLRTDDGPQTLAVPAAPSAEASSSTTTTGEATTSTTNRFRLFRNPAPWLGTALRV